VCASGVCSPVLGLMDVDRDSRFAVGCESDGSVDKSVDKIAGVVGGSAEGLEVTAQGHLLDASMTSSKQTDFHTNQHSESPAEANSEPSNMYQQQHLDEETQQNTTKQITNRHDTNIHASDELSLSHNSDFSMIAQRGTQPISAVKPVSADASVVQTTVDVGLRPNTTTSPSDITGDQHGDQQSRVRSESGTSEVEFKSRRRSATRFSSSWSGGASPSSMPANAKTLTPPLKYQSRHTSPPQAGAAASETSSPTIASSDALHPLQSAWTLWIIVARQPSDLSWEDKMQNAHEFSTVEHFWCMHNNIHSPSSLGHGDYYLFRKGINPDWNDPVFRRGGGRFVLQLPSRYKHLDDAWLSAILLMIGEGYDQSVALPLSVCGAAVSCRAKLNKIALWVATSDLRQLHEIGQSFMSLVDGVLSGRNVTGGSTGDTKPEPKVDVKPEFESFRRDTPLDSLFGGGQEKQVISWGEMCKRIGNVPSF